MWQDMTSRRNSRDTLKAAAAYTRGQSIMRGKIYFCYLCCKKKRVGAVPKVQGLLEGSWNLVTRVINKVTILIITYNPN